MKKIISMLAALLVAATVAMAGVHEEKNIATGSVTDTNGKPIAGAVVSDGYSCVVTDAEGKFTFKRNPAALYIWCSIPAEYEIPLRQGQPCFYRKYSEGEPYNFILTPLKKGKETKFNLFLVGDPQSQYTSHVQRLKEEGIAAIKTYAKKQHGPCYGVTLGDIGYTEGVRNTNYLLPIIRQEMSSDKAGMPLFQTVGNHDFEYAPGETGPNDPTPSIRRDRMFENVFGPVDYSWNRGDAHIISMNNVMFENLVKASKYHGDFTAEQIEWLRQDLNFVPKDKLVIFCVHIPITGLKKRECYQPVMDLLRQFENVRIISGHTHTMIDAVHENGVEELTVAALSGCWWWSKNCADGTPNGFEVFHINGNKIESTVYKASNFPESYQSRIYRGDAVYGGKYEEFKLQEGHDTFLINVWNFQKGWTIECYENGHQTAVIFAPEPASSDFVPQQGSTKDWWAIGYNVGVVGRGHIPGSTRNNYCSKNHHMFRYKLLNPDAKFKIVVVDNAGRRYPNSKIFETAEYETYAMPPAYEKSMQW